MLKEISVQQYLDEYKGHKKDYVLVFHAEWCPACKMFKQTLDEVAQKENVEVIRLNIDHDPDKKLVSEFGVSSIPFWVMFKNGEKVFESLGFLPVDAFTQKIKTYLK
ncbi:thioredoxin family protein [Mycoplasmopsis columbinasalis]|uniref:Thioredoxin n=1 Tax=Mycoplasmopsis columbinasalis TaxID=114880 RepID=A0A449B9U0_9BACT|nr:thioredoxin family protein [Mycoplasmopsis columbinasalis]VEU77951.1 Thioredoxin [Mycoplasmopsis columbinasalis]